MIADLNMDMYLPLFPLKYLEVQGLDESTLGEDIRAVAGAAGVQVQADKEPEHNRFIRSDQYSFIKKGVPALAFKFGWVPGTAEQKTFKAWYADRYHAPSDDLSQPVDLAAAKQFDAILEKLALRIVTRSSVQRGNRRASSAGLPISRLAFFWQRLQWFLKVRLSLTGEDVRRLTVLALFLTNSRDLLPIHESLTQSRDRRPYPEGACLQRHRFHLAGGAYLDRRAIDTYSQMNRARIPGPRPC